jgi:hypothetical protein
MNRLLGLLLISGLLGVSLRATAELSVAADTEIGDRYSSQNAELSSDMAKLEDPGLSFAQWNIFAELSRSKSEDATTGVITTYNSRHFSGGAGLAYAGAFTADLSLNSTRTPETDFTQTGGSLDLAFLHRFGEAAGFRPRFSLGLGYGSSNIEQGLSFKILNRQVDRQVDLTQKRISAFVSCMPAEWVRARISASTYDYSKSKSDIQTAFNNRFLNYFTGDLVATIGGLPEYSSLAKLTFYVWETWDVEIFQSKTHLIVDDSTSTRTQVKLSKTWDAWIFGLGLARTDTALYLDSTLLGSLSYDF